MSTYDSLLALEQSSFYKYTELSFDKILCLFVLFWLYYGLMSIVQYFSYITMLLAFLSYSDANLERSCHKHKTGESNPITLSAVTGRTNNISKH